MFNDELYLEINPKLSLKFDYTTCPRLGKPRVTPDELFELFYDYTLCRGYRQVHDKGNVRICRSGLSISGFIIYLQDKDIINLGSHKYWYGLDQPYDSVKDAIEDRLEDHNAQALLNNDVSTAGMQFYLKNKFGWKDKFDHVNVNVTQESTRSDAELEKIASVKAVEDDIIDAE